MPDIWHEWYNRPQMKILFLAHRIPYPPNKGDKIRSFNEIRHLSKRHEIHLVCLADDPEDIRYAENLRKWCRRVFVQPVNARWAKLKGLWWLSKGGAISVGYFYHRNVQETVDQWMKETNYDGVFGFSSSVAEYLFRGKEKDHKGDAPWAVMDFCDVDSDKWRQYAQKSPFPMNLLYRMEHRRMTAYERRVNRYFDRSVFVSRPEARLFKEIHPRATGVSVVTNGVDHHFFCPEAAAKPVNTDGPMLMFAGAMDYHANVDGVRWFASDILPDIRKSFPEAHFYIVGNNPHAAVRELAADAAMTVTGYVEDIRSYHLAAEVFVVPLRIARGVQNKVLEAMAMGKAVVTTSMAIQGIHPRPEECLMVADAAQEFAASVTQLLGDADLRNELGRKARDFIERHYQWDACMKDLESVLMGDR